MDAVVLLPPVLGLAHRYEWAEALQYTVLSLVAPGLLVLGAPWPWAGLGRMAASLSEARRRHREWVRTAAIAVPALACLVAWRTPAAVNALRGGGWLLALEGASLSAAGILLWLEIVESPPLSPRSARPTRIGLSAVSMWAMWTLAYLSGMSKGNWYGGYDHILGRGLSLAADQQVAAGAMWALATASFVPLIFWNLLRWLRGEEDPDHELDRLVREEGRRALPPR